MLGWLVGQAVVITANLATSYAIVPICGAVATHIGTYVGTYVGTQAVRRIYRAGVDKLRGSVTLTLRRSRIYIINHGTMIDIDPRKKYIIERGHIKVLDGYEPTTMGQTTLDLVDEYDPETDTPMEGLSIAKGWTAL